MSNAEPETISQVPGSAPFQYWRKSAGVIIIGFFTPDSKNLYRRSVKHRPLLLWLPEELDDHSYHGSVSLNYLSLLESEPVPKSECNGKKFIQ